MNEKKEFIKVGADRPFVFNRQLRYDRQKNYDINDYETVPFSFDYAGNLDIYKNFNFSIFIDDYCNADCKFCVAQLRYEHRNLIYKKEKLEYDDYIKQLEFVLKTIRPLNPSISITGGEPTISPKLIDVLKLVDKYGFRKRTITTNGSHLLDMAYGRTVLENLIKYGWQHLNISRTSTDDKLNQEIMRYNSHEGYCDNEMLKEILRVTNGSTLAHRISCLLLQDSVNSVEKIKDFVEFYCGLGANNFIFRQLMDYSHDAVNVEKMHYCESNKVDLNDIWEDFEKYPEFVPFLNILGYYYYVEIYKYKNMATVAGESADMKVQYKEFEAHPNTIYEMVFHPNGNLCGSWVDKDKILIPWEK